MVRLHACISYKLSELCRRRTTIVYWYLQRYSAHVDVPCASVVLNISDGCLTVIADNVHS